MKISNHLKFGGDMYCIVVYDIGEKRVGKMLKLTRQYFNWIQNSVFEGETTEAKILEFLHYANKIIKKEEDSIIIYKMTTNKYLDRKIIGVDKSKYTSNIL